MSEFLNATEIAQKIANARIPNFPPRSFYVYAEIDGKQIVGESLADGKIQSAEVGSDGKK